MFTKPQLTLSRVFLTLFLRDKQSLFFSLVFPAILITVFALANNSEPSRIRLAVADNSGSDVAAQFSLALSSDPLFSVSSGEEAQMRSALLQGEHSVLLILPANFEDAESGAELTLVVDAAQVRQLGLIMPALEQKLIQIEREFRGTEPLFSLAVEDVKARSQNYLSFLLPGLLAFTLMQLAIAGSGFNIVEYRRKGILKRLFVTPIKPRDFITAIVLARTVLILVQLAVLLSLATYMGGVTIVGSVLAFFFVVLVNTFLFLCLGFFLGSLAKTQQSIMALGNLVIFPQAFLSGIFYPIESMPAFLQPIAQLLPLSFATTAMREIANNGAALIDIVPTLVGLCTWLLVAFFIATRFFVWKEVAK